MLQQILRNGVHWQQKHTESVSDGKNGKNAKNGKNGKNGKKAKNGKNDNNDKNENDKHERRYDTKKARQPTNEREESGACSCYPERGGGS